ncbi:MAG: hypothetical protein ABR578_10075 [Chromatocurvus sp.]
MAAHSNPLASHPPEDLAQMARAAAFELDTLLPFLEFCDEVLRRYPKKAVPVRAVLGLVNIIHDKVGATRDALS